MPLDHRFKIDNALEGGLRHLKLALCLSFLLLKLKQLRLQVFGAAINPAGDLARQFHHIFGQTSITDPPMARLALLYPVVDLLRDVIGAV